MLAGRFFWICIMCTELVTHIISPIYNVCGASRRWNRFCSYLLSTVVCSKTYMCLWLFSFIQMENYICWYICGNASLPLRSLIKNCSRKYFFYAGILVRSVTIVLSWNWSRSLELSKNFAMYLFYIAVKSALHWIVIAFKDSGSILCNNVSFISHMMATYEGAPYPCSFFIYLYNLYYVVGSVMDIKRVS